MKAIRTLVLVLLVSLAPSLGLAQQSASNAAPARPESERLRQELLALLVDVRSASAVLSAQSSYDEFMVKIGRIEKRLSSIRKKYQIPLSRGDHKALGAPISDACAALYAVAANEVAGAQRAVAHAAPWEVDFFQRQLQSAKVKQAEAQKHLTDHTATTLALVQAATRVQEASKKQAITVQK